jgi:hypothetical protein
MGEWKCNCSCQFHEVCIQLMNFVWGESGEKLSLQSSSGLGKTLCADINSLYSAMSCEQDRAVVCLFFFIVTIMGIFSIIY